MCSEGTEESAVIVGGDADLVLQGLALPQVRTPSVSCARCLSRVMLGLSVRSAVR